MKTIKNTINENTTNHTFQLMMKESTNTEKFLQLYYMLSMPVRANNFSKKDLLDLMYVLYNICIKSKIKIFSLNTSNTYFRKYYENVDFSDIPDYDEDHVISPTFIEDVIKTDFKFDNIYITTNKIIKYSAMTDVNTVECLYFLILKNYNYLNLLPLKSPNNYTPKNIEKWARENGVSTNNIFEILHDHLVSLEVDIEALNWIKNFPTDLKKSYYEKETINFSILKTYILKFLELDDFDKKRIKGIFFKKADENGAGIISSYKNFIDFKVALKAQFITIESPDSIIDKIEVNDLKNQVDIIYNDNDIVIMDIHTNEASIALGTTAWCISRRGALNFSNNYMKVEHKPKLYFIYNFNLEQHNKYFMIGTNIKNGIFNLTCDKNNHEISESNFKNYLREYNIPVELFRKFQKKDLKKQKNINDPLIEKYNEIKQHHNHINQVVYFLENENDFKKVYKKHPDISKYMIYSLLCNVIDEYNKKVEDMGGSKEKEIMTI